MEEEYLELGQVIENKTMNFGKRQENKFLFSCNLKIWNSSSAEQTFSACINDGFGDEEGGKVELETQHLGQLFQAKLPVPSRVELRKEKFFIEFANRYF